MKKTLLILFTLTLTPTLHAQGIWTPRDTLPDSAMGQGISGFSIGNYGYAGLGNYNNAVGSFDELWQFDPSTNSWTEKAPFPGMARVAPASFVIGDNAYLVTGSVKNFGACVTECWQYNAPTDTWTRKADFPGSERTYAVGFAVDTVGYVGTGANELRDFRNDFYAYHPSTNTWTSIADLPSIARDGSSGFAVNGKGYVCFGQDSTLKLYPDMWEYDPGTDSWTQKTAFANHLFLASGFAICNSIYVGSGDTTNGGAGLDSQFWKYNTIFDSWAQVASVPGFRRVEGAAFALGDTGYYGFGFDTAALVHNTFERFYNNDSCYQLDEGLNLIAHKPEIEIYPNPFHQECFIILPFNAIETPLFSLYDAAGRKMQINIQTETGNAQYILERNTLEEGLYILSIKYNGTSVYKKLIITL